MVVFYYYFVVFLVIMLGIFFILFYYSFLSASFSIIIPFYYLFLLSFSIIHNLNDPTHVRQGRHVGRTDVTTGQSIHHHSRRDQRTHRTPRALPPIPRRLRPLLRHHISSLLYFYLFSHLFLVSSFLLSSLIII